MSDPVEEIINQLHALSPMPNDLEVTAEQLTKYDSLVNILAQYMDRRCIRPLIESFGYGSGGGVYWGVVHLLERFTVDETDPILLEGLQNHNAGTRMWSALMIGRSENELAIPELLRLLDDSKELVRAEAIIALGRFGGDDIRKHLLKLKGDPSREVQAALKIALQ